MDYWQFGGDEGDCWDFLIGDNLVLRAGFLFGSFMMDYQQSFESTDLVVTFYNQHLGCMGCIAKIE